MDLSQRIDAYCERMDPGFWAEPFNALTNLAFILAALWCAWRLRGTGLLLGWALAGTLFAIGVGSFLFHSFATVWAALADVIPIGLFVLIYAFAINRDMLGWPVWAAGLGTAAVIPYSVAAGVGFGALPFFAISAAYWPIVLGIVLYAFFVSTTLRTGFLIGAALLTLSLTARSLDMPFCEALPLGTHFVWHLLNAIMLAWMIALYRRHMLAGGAGQS